LLQACTVFIAFCIQERLTGIKFSETPEVVKPTKPAVIKGIESLLVCKSVICTCFK